MAKKYKHAGVVYRIGRKVGRQTEWYVATYPKWARSEKEGFLFNERPVRNPGEFVRAYALYPIRKASRQKHSTR